MHVIDNFLPQELFVALKEAVASPKQIWYYFSNISTDMYKVVDDFLPQRQYDALKEFIDSEKQSWSPYNKIDHELVNVSQVDKRKHYGFSCNVVKYEAPYVYERLPCTGLVYAFHQKIKDEFGYTKCVRCRLDMTTYRGEDEVIFGPHIDLEGKDTTTVFHLTDCDAPTIVYNEKSKGVSQYVEDIDDDIKFVPKMKLTVLEEVEAKENRLILFDGDQIHTGTCARDVSHRIVINSNFI
tara:strand:+ start:403 stop:1119 length:717 start_codon:yes stop_codon:yes gene_type:complete